MRDAEPCVTSRLFPLSSYGDGSIASSQRAVDILAAQAR